MTSVIERLSPQVPRPMAAQLSFKQASQFTNLSESYLRTLAREGKIVSVKVGRRRLVDRASLESLIQS